jgi:diaminopimelate epimerase
VSRSPLRFVKGHGTENDFVVLPDADGDIALTPGLVRAICDRHTGIGADGVLRAVRTAADPDAAHWSAAAGWFMDYRNADGSVAEMCGNGIRVFARYLVDRLGVPPGEIAVATRGGVRVVRVAAAGDVSVDMGTYDLPDLGEVRVQVGDRIWRAAPVTLPNPHAVVFVSSLDDAGDLRRPPVVTPADAYPDGVNVEFVLGRGPQRIAMRVFERGVGETRSCGTGACAAMVAAAQRDRVSGPAGYTVDLPGGTLRVCRTPDERIELTGPAVLVAEGEIIAEGWA